MLNLYYKLLLNKIFILYIYLYNFINGKIINTVMGKYVILIIVDNN